MGARHTIVICMGSSCFARGNRLLLPAIERFLKAHELADEVEIVGSRCEESCSEGPTLIIDGKQFHHMDEGALIDVLERHFLKEPETHGN